MKMVTKTSAAALALIAFLAMTPGKAMAGGSLHLDLPGLSIGVHDGHRRHYRKRYRHRHHHGYYDDYGYRKHYRKHRKYRRHHRRHHYQNDYYDNYYYGGRRYRDRDYRRYDYSRPRRVERCPDRGYSRYWQRNRGCYEHGDHYHCGG